MKIKLLKTLAVVIAVCLTFAGFSAFAADVVIETSYDCEQAENANVTVKASVRNIAQGSEVTYYVSNENGIVYMNQGTAGADGVTFPAFRAPWDDTLLSSTVKFGSNASWSADGFTFVNAGNYKTNGAVDAVADDVAWAQASSYVDEETSETVNGIIYTAKVSGNYSEYGVTLTIDGVAMDFAALGCSEDGTYSIFIAGVDAADITAAAAYAN